MDKDDERRKGYDTLKRGLDAVQTDMKNMQETVIQNRAQAEGISKAIQTHEKNTAVTGQKVDTVIGAVTRIEDKMDTLTEVVVETRTHGLDTREGLTRTRTDMDKLNELVLRHDEKLSDKEGPIMHPKLLATGGLIAVLVFVGYHIDKDATDMTLAAIRGLF